MNSPPDVRCQGSGHQKKRVSINLEGENKFGQHKSNSQLVFPAKESGNEQRGNGAVREVQLGEGRGGSLGVQGELGRAPG